MEDKPNQQAATPEMIVFTPGSIKVMQAAMQVFEPSLEIQGLEQSSDQLQRKALMRAAMQSINDKLNVIQANQGRYTTFDYAEKVVVLAAVKQYLAPFDKALTAEQQEERRICHQITQILRMTITLPTHD